MIISDQHKFIFVHVPKTAGDSVTQALAPYATPLKRTLWKSIRRRLPVKDRVETIYLRKHDPASRAIARLGRAKWDSYKSFAVVRNPFDHAVSHYEFMKQFRIAAVAAKVAAMRFPDYLDYRAKPPFWNDTFFARLPNQSYFLTDPSGAIAVDRIVRFEEIGTDFKSACEEIGLHGVDLPHVNKTKSKSKKRPFQDYYDTTAIQKVRSLYADDFRLLGYDTELPRAT